MTEMTTSAGFCGTIGADENQHRTYSRGPYRARTDDIHGVNVALYQLS